MPMFAAGRSRRLMAGGTGAVAGARSPTRWRDLELDEANTLRCRLIFTKNGSVWSV